MSDLAAVREFVKKQLTSDQLVEVCHDYFPDVYDEFAPGMASSQRIQLLLDYCQRQGRLDGLLGALRRLQPALYRRYLAPQLARQLPEEPPPVVDRVRNPRQVFISHAHQDRELAQRLATDLQAGGWPVWIAPDSIRPGEKWVEAISRGLDESGIFVVLLTPESVASPWVMLETNAVIELELQKEVRFLPLLARPCRPPVLWGNYQRVSLLESYQHGLARLLAELDPSAAAMSPAVAVRTPRPAEAQPPPPAAPPQVEIDVPPQKEQPEAAAERTAQPVRVRPAATPQQPPAKADMPPQKQRPAGQPPAGQLALKRLVARLKALPAAVWIGGGLILVVALLMLGLRSLLPVDGDEAATTQASVAVPTQDPSRLPLAATPIATQTRPGDGMVMVYVPEGSFLMGSAADDPDAYDWEKPQHRVALDAFWLDQTEVTNFQYERCVADGDCRESIYADAADWNGRQQPVVGVSWEDAAAYCAWAGGQLPTEAQWEYAARGPESLKYPWGNDAPDETLLNYNDNVGRTTEVGSYPAGASWVGALDMAGNVWEWVADWYDRDYYDISPAANPAGPASGGVKVLRGGSWGSSARGVRGANRLYSSASGRSHGFRCLVPQG